MKKIILIMLAAVMIFSVSACSSSSGKSTESQKTGTVESTSAETTAETTGADTKTAAVSPGNYIEGENFKITFEQAKTYDEIQDPDNEYMKSTPAEGKEYLVLFFEVENISSEDQYVNILYQNAYLDDYGIDSTMILTEPEGYGSLAGDVAVGKKLKGCVCYEVDPDWKSLEFTYSDGVVSAEEYDFVVTPDDLS